MMATDVAMARALERGELPASGFHHADHLRVACVYLQESPSVDEARGRMAATLTRFAASVGKPEKYSDAVTAFWVYQLAAARALLPHADADALFRAFPQLLDRNLVNPADAAPTRASDSPGDAPDRPLPRESS
jgi:hypothetical protein